MIGEVAYRAAAHLVLDAHDRLRDALPLVLEEEHLDGVAHVLGIPLRHVLEHVAGREFEITFLVRRVVRTLPDEFVELEHVVARLREADRGVDDAARERVLVGGHRRLKTRSAFSRRNFGHTLSRNGTSGNSLKIRSSDNPIG